MIKVEKVNDHFKVTITEDNSRTQHLVTLNDEYDEYLTQKKISKEELIKKSFEFLLKREKKESILNKFNLKTINSYFPGFELEVMR